MSWLTGLLEKVLKPFVTGINPETLSVSLWDGEVRLRDLELRPEALDGFNLPVHVLGAFVGEVYVSVPWRSLGSRSIVLRVDRVYALVGPASSAAYDPEAERKSEQESKSAQLAGWEALTDRAAEQHGSAPRLVARETP